MSSSSGGLVSTATSASVGEYYILSSAESIYLRIVDDSNDAYLGVVSTGNTYNKWNFIVAIYNGDGSNSGMKIYINGEEKEASNSNTNTYIAMKGAAFNLYIGKRENLFNGKIDDVRIYNGALSSSQIKQNYIAGLNSLYKNGSISKKEYNQRIESLGLNF